MKTIAYITGNRADFGLITPLLKALQRSSTFSLNLYATGTHLMHSYGYTINLVRSTFPQVKILDVVMPSQDRQGAAYFGAKLMTTVIEEFTQNRPDIVILHGDRIEMLITAITCLYIGIPLAHIHGGDKTATVDDSARHAITKIAHIHFPATKRAALRIRSMGEEDWRIHVVGALGIDALRQTAILPRGQLLEKLGLPDSGPFILVLQHPVSEEINHSSVQMKRTLNAAKRFNLPVVVIYPNGDPGSKAMIDLINQEKQSPSFKIYEHLDYETFASLQKEAGVWVGNSSAGIVESTFFRTPVVNIGPRQEGRERSPNIIDVGYNEHKICRAIQRSLYDEGYRKTLEGFHSPWGDGKAVPRIINILKNLNTDWKHLGKKNEQ